MQVLADTAKQRCAAPSKVGGTNDVTVSNWVNLSRSPTSSPDRGGVNISPLGLKETLA